MEIKEEREIRTCDTKPGTSSQLPLKDIAPFDFFVDFSERESLGRRNFKSEGEGEEE